MEDQRVDQAHDLQFAAMSSWVVECVENNVQQHQTGAGRPGYIHYSDIICIVCLALNWIPYSVPAMNMENLEGDYFVPGTELCGENPLWKEIQARVKRFNFINNCLVIVWIPVRLYRKTLSSFGHNGPPMTLTRRLAQMALQNRRPGKLVPCFEQYHWKDMSLIPDSENGHARSSWDGGTAPDFLSDELPMAAPRALHWERQGAGFHSGYVVQWEPQLKQAKGCTNGGPRKTPNSTVVFKFRSTKPYVLEVRETFGYLNWRGQEWPNLPNHMVLYCGFLKPQYSGAWNPGLDLYIVSMKSNWTEWKLLDR